MSPELMECLMCKGICIKKGNRKKVQKYQCKSCKKYQQARYIYGKYSPEKERLIMQFNNEGCGISSIARITKLSKTTIVRKIKTISLSLEFKPVLEKRQMYEVDEMKTFVGNKENESWVMYAINRRTKSIPFFIVGRRTSLNISEIVKPLLALSPTKISTDRLNIYPGLVPKEIHETKHHGINHVERINLSLKHFLKRLNRKTIAYSKSEEMLLHCCRLFFYTFNKAL